MTENAIKYNSKEKLTEDIHTFYKALEYITDKWLKM
jgi:hypothetical protein